MKNNKGIALIQGLIVAGLVAAASALVVNYGALQNKNSQRGIKKGVSDNIEKIVTKLLTTQSFCQRALNGRSFPNNAGGTLTGIVLSDAAGGVVLNSSTVISGVTIEGIEIDYPADTLWEIAGVNKRVKLSGVTVSLAYSLGNQLFRTRKSLNTEGLPVVVKNAGNNFVSCQYNNTSTVAEAVEEACIGMGGTYNPLPANPSDPKCDLNQAVIGVNDSVVGDDRKATGLAQLNNYYDSRFLHKNPVGDQAFQAQKGLSVDRLEALDAQSTNALLNLRQIREAYQGTCSGAGMLTGNAATYFGVFTQNNGIRCQNLKCASGQQFVGLAADGSVQCRNILSSVPSNCPGTPGTDYTLTVNGNGEIQFNCCTQNCSATSNNYPIGSFYPEPGGCGQCAGTGSDKYYQCTAQGSWEQLGDCIPDSTNQLNCSASSVANNDIACCSSTNAPSNSSCSPIGTSLNSYLCSAGTWSLGSSSGSTGSSTTGASSGACVASNSSSVGTWCGVAGTASAMAVSSGQECSQSNSSSCGNGNGVAYQTSMLCSNLTGQGQSTCEAAAFAKVGHNCSPGAAFCDWDPSAGSSSSGTSGSVSSSTCTSHSPSCNSGATVADGTSICCNSAPNSTCSGGASTCTQFIGNSCSSSSQCGPGGTCVGGSSGGSSGASSCSTPGPYRVCFLENTMITMADGQQKPIQELKEGDYVKTLVGGVFEGENYIAARIDKTIKSFNEGYKYGINWKQVNNRSVFVTGGHPFMTIDGSWKAFEPENTPIKERVELSVTRLDLGDILVRDDGLEAIIAFRKELTREFVYNFEVNGVHEYIAEGYRVHNKTACSATNGNSSCPAANPCINSNGYAIYNGSGNCASGSCSSSSGGSPSCVTSSTANGPPNTNACIADISGQCAPCENMTSQNGCNTQSGTWDGTKVNYCTWSSSGGTSGTSSGICSCGPCADPINPSDVNQCCSGQFAAPHQTMIVCPFGQSCSCAPQQVTCSPANGTCGVGSCPPVECGCLAGPAQCVNSAAACSNMGGCL